MGHNFICAASAADAKGNYGCEVWLSIQHSFTQNYFDVPALENVRIICAEPRFLAVHVILTVCKFIAVSAHAVWTIDDPDHLEACIKWWKKFFIHYQKLLSYKVPIVCCIDALLPVDCDVFVRTCLMHT